jgi:hypothetical protein
MVFNGVWNHVKESEQPPLYDPISYMEKAKNFWHMVASQHYWKNPLHWKNPLNLSPAFRPPGTVLMSYPFGFSEDYKGFLARSIILPVLLLVAALYVAAYRGRMSRAEHLDLLAVAFLLASLPCFYHFEGVYRTNSPTHWGLVDNFLAAVAALAFAIGYRSVRQRSWSLLILASLANGFCLMIKPTGAIVAGIIILVLTVLMITEELLASDNTLSWTRAFRFIFSFRLVSFLGALSLGTCLFLVASINSDYFSGDTIQAGNVALKVLRDDFASALSVENFKTVLYASFGLNVIILGLVTAVAAIRTLVEGIQLRDPRCTVANLVKPVVAAAVVAAGAFFWLAYADLGQIRYCYPFAFVSLILMAIFLLDAIRGRPAPYTRLLIYGSSAILFGGLAVMMYVRQIDLSWQQRFGVNLSSSSSHEERLLADLLLQRAKTAGRDLDVYLMDLRMDLATIGSAGAAQKVLRPTEPSFSAQQPVDWAAPSVVHLQDLFLADSIVYHPVAGAVNPQVASPGKKIENLLQEIETISTWMTQANEECGLKELARGKIAVKGVVDRKLFARSLVKWAAGQDWPDAFKSENSEFLQQTDPAIPFGEITPSAGPIEIFDQTIAVDDIQVETLSPLRFRVDWHALTENVPDDLYFFVQVFDARNKVRSNCQFYLSSRLWTVATPLVSHRTLLPANINVRSGTLRYAFGIFEATQGEKPLIPNLAGGEGQAKRVVREVNVP